MHWQYNLFFYCLKILTGNIDATTVKNTTLQYAVDTKFVKISVVDKEGNHPCMRIELYETGKYCGQLRQVLSFGSKNKPEESIKNISFP